MIATVSDASDTPAEIRLLTAGKGGAQPQPHQQPASREVGLGKDGGASLSAVMALLDIEPFSAKTPICRHIREVADQIRRLTVAAGKVAILVLLVDGAATDGDPADALRPLEGLPVQVIVRVYTEERDVHDYWHRVSSHVDLDVHVLGTALTEARRAAEHNPWLNYGEPLHRCALLPLAAPCPSVAPLDPPAPLCFRRHSVLQGSGIRRGHAGSGGRRHAAARPEGSQGAAGVPALAARRQRPKNRRGLSRPGDRLGRFFGRCGCGRRQPPARVLPAGPPGMCALLFRTL